MISLIFQPILLLTLLNCRSYEAIKFVPCSQINWPPPPFSFCSWTRVFTVNFNILTRVTTKLTIRSFDRGIADNVCLKFPGSNINAFPNGLMFSPKSFNGRSRGSSVFVSNCVHSSWTISLHFFYSGFLISDTLEMSHVEVLMNCMFNGNF